MNSRLHFGSSISKLTLKEFPSYKKECLWRKPLLLPKNPKKGVKTLKGNTNNVEMERRQ